MVFKAEMVCSVSLDLARSYRSVRSCLVSVADNCATRFGVWHDHALSASFEASVLDRTFSLDFDFILQKSFDTIRGAKKFQKHALG